MIILNSRLKNKLKNKSVIAIILFILIALPALALDKTKILQINLVAQTLNTAVSRLADSVGAQILFKDAELANIQTKQINGQMSLEQALDTLLADTNLEYSWVDDNTVVIRKKSLTDEGFDDTEALDTVVVTGSQLITEPSSLSRQVDIFYIEEVRAMGAHDLNSFFKLLPQNIASASSVGVGLNNNQFGSAQNLYGSSSVNLRGIGDGTTLILIDGKRVAAGGIFGDAVDINNFPLYTIERIEIIYDGASAIYGSDAIGGVVNIITKKDYEGTVLDINHSQPTSGGSRRTQVDLGHTFSWDNSRLTLGVSTQFESDLDASDRNIDFSNSFNVIPYGNPGNLGSAASAFDFNTGESILLPLFYIDPATGERIDTQVAEEMCFPDGAGGEYCFTSYTWIADLGVDISGLTPIFQAQLPQGFSGILSQDDIIDFDPSPSGLSGVRDLTLIPANETFNYRMNYAYDFSNDTKFHINASYSDSENDYSFQNSDLLLSVNQQENSPFSIPVLMYVAADFLPVSTQHTTNDNLFISTGLDGKFSDNWSWDLAYSFNQNKYESIRENTRNFNNFSVLRNGVDFDPITFEQFPSPYNPFVPLFGLSSEAEFIDNFIIPALLTTTDSKQSDLSFKIRGTAFKTNAGDASVLFGVGVTREELAIYDESQIAIGRGTGVGYEPISDSVYYDFSGARTPQYFNTEIYVPLVSDKNARTGIQRLALTGAYRYDDYDQFSGDSWAAGIIYSPTSWLSIVANISESFKAPTVADSLLPQSIGFEFLDIYSDDVTFPIDFSQEFPIDFIDIQQLQGANPDLKPEIGKTKSLGMRFSPESLAGFTAEINYSENEFIDQVGTYATIILPFWTQSQLAAIQSGTATNPFLRFEDGTFIQDARTYNISDQRIRNIDAKMAYTQYTDSLGIFGFRITYNRALENALRIIDAGVCANNACNFNGPVGEFVDRIERAESSFGTIIPKHRANLNFNWEYKNFGANLTYFYQSEIIRPASIYSPELNDLILTVVTTRPATPVNLEFSYNFDNWGWVDGAFVRLIIPNIFNDQLKLSRNPVVPGIAQGRLDSRFSNPYGRVISLQLQLRF